MKKRQAAFTLVELLVVIGIIALLISILMPVLQKARVAALRVQCGSNLHQWGISLTAYAAENKGKLPETVRADSPIGCYPNIAWIYQQPNAGTSRNATQTNQFSVEAIAPYMPGVNFDKREFGQLWVCPANAGEDTNAFNALTWNDGTGLNSYFHFQYSYYANVGKWGIVNGFAVASRPDELCDMRMASDRLLMSDWLYYWSAGVWAYNHGKNGASAFYSGGAISGDPGPPKTNGMNKLFADGHVVWDGDYDPKQLQDMVRGAADRNMHWVTAGGSSYTFY
jgi:prepilin-type N-terminal cleavage/methylation domain-containing protein/prepilin-type processing-associated H-X9-DG protein